MILLERDLEASETKANEKSGKEKEHESELEEARRQITQLMHKIDTLEGMLLASPGQSNVWLQSYGSG